MRKQKKLKNERNKIKKKERKNEENQNSIIKRKD